MASSDAAVGLRSPSRIVIVDEHDLVRAGLRQILDSAPDLTVVGEAAGLADAGTLCRRLQPDLILIDIQLDGHDHRHVVAGFAAGCPSARIVVISTHDDIPFLVQAVKAGVDGYLHKDASGREIVDTVRRVLRGGEMISPEAALQVVRRLVQESFAPESAASTPLTPRELDVLTLLTEGCTNHQIAGALGIGTGTVRFHVQHVLEKLGVHHRTQAAVQAILLGLVQPHGRTPEVFDRDVE